MASKRYQGRGRPSTDGTWLGAEIAETMGTTDENEIIAEGRGYLKRHAEESLTGMPEEQADWENACLHDGIECDPENPPCPCLCPTCLEL